MVALFVELRGVFYGDFIFFREDAPKVTEALACFIRVEVLNVHGSDLYHVENLSGASLLVMSIAVDGREVGLAFVYAFKSLSSLGLCFDKPDFLAKIWQLGIQIVCVM